MEGVRGLISGAQIGISRGLNWAAATTRESLSLWTWDALHSSRFFDIMLADQIGYAPLNEDRDAVSDPADKAPRAGAR